MTVESLNRFVVVSSEFLSRVRVNVEALVVEHDSLLPCELLEGINAAVVFGAVFDLDVAETGNVEARGNCGLDGGGERNEIGALRMLGDIRKFDLLDDGAVAAQPDAGGVILDALLGQAESEVEVVGEDLPFVVLPVGVAAVELGEVNDLSAREVKRRVEALAEALLEVGDEARSRRFGHVSEGLGFAGFVVAEVNISGILLHMLGHVGDCRRRGKDGASYCMHGESPNNVRRISLSRCRPLHCSLSRKTVFRLSPIVTNACSFFRSEMRDKLFPPNAQPSPIASNHAGIEGCLVFVSPDDGSRAFARRSKTRVRPVGLAGRSGLLVARGVAMEWPRETE